MNEPDRGGTPVDAVTRAVLAIVRDDADDRKLAERICRAYAEGLDVDGAAISLLTATAAAETLWATDATAALLEDLQLTLNEGACIDAARTGCPVLVPDLRHAGETARWPIFAAVVAEQTEVRGLFALPLQWGTVNLGVLELYRTAPGGLTDVQRGDAVAAAGAAALAMMLAQLTQLSEPADPSGEDRVGWLDDAVGGHAEIHQATGMVLAQLEVSASDALARLRGHAFVEQRLLVDVARDVVARRLVFTRDMG